jgi:hypothetical protein
MPLVAPVLVQQPGHLAARPVQVGAQSRQHLRGHAVALAEDAEQDVLGADVVVAAPPPVSVVASSSYRPSVLAGEPLPCCLLRHAERLSDAGPADATVAQDGHGVVDGCVGLGDHRLNPGQA